MTNDSDSENLTVGPIKVVSDGKVIEVTVAVRDETDEERRASREQDDQLLGTDEAARFHGEK